MLSNYEKCLYNEALLMRRHLDIQQKIHKKTRMRETKPKEDHDIVNGEFINHFNTKMKEYK